MSIVAISSYVASKTIYNAIYPEVLIKSILSITSSLVSNIYHMVTTTQDIDLKKILITSDIINDITIIKSFIEEKHEKELENVNKTILTCIHNIEDTLKEIDDVIKCINNKFEIHQKMWFSYFRSYDISVEKERIIFLSDRLKHRFELLIKIYSTLK